MTINPYPITESMLVKRVTGIAIAAVMANHWDEGSRNDTTLALSGLLARFGVPLDDAESILIGICTIADDDEVESRIKAAESTYEKLEAGEAVTGGAKLVELVGEKVVTAIKKWLKSVGFVAKTSVSQNTQNANKPQLLTDAENAERFASDHRSFLRFCFSKKKWFIWNGKIWQEDNTGRVTFLIKSMVRKILSEVSGGEL